MRLSGRVILCASKRKHGTRNGCGALFFGGCSWRNDDIERNGCGRWPTSGGSQCGRRIARGQSVRDRRLGGCALVLSACYCCHLDAIIASAHGSHDHYGCTFLVVFLVRIPNVAHIELDVFHHHRERLLVFLIGDNPWGVHQIP